MRPGVPLLPLAAFGVVVLAANTAQAKPKRLGPEAALYPEIPPGGPCPLGAIQPGSECLYPAPAPGAYVDLNFANYIWQGDDLEQWRRLGARRLTQGQRLLLHAFDMAYGTDFMKSRPGKWGPLERKALDRTVADERNRAIWPEVRRPVWHRRRMKNLSVKRGWLPGPLDEAERVREAGSPNYPVIWLPEI